MSKPSSFPGLLVLTNVVLLIASTTIMYLGASLIAFYLLDKIDFVSSWFSFVPHSMIILGVGNFLVALFGCFVASTQSRCLLTLYAFLMALLFVLQLGGIFGAVELRGVINNNYISGADAHTALEGYATDASVKARWDSLQKEFKCCGAINFNDGYQKWRNVDLGEESSVPDTCCLQFREGCGSRAFLKNPEVLQKEIYTHGCLTVMKDRLEEQVVPVLLGYAGVGVVLALLQLLSVVFACSFSAQISRRINKQLDGAEEHRYLQGDTLSVPPTPRFDIVRPGAPGSVFGRDNMSQSFQGDSIDRAKYAQSTMSDFEERDV